MDFIIGLAIWFQWRDFPGISFRHTVDYIICRVYSTDSFQLNSNNLSYYTQEDIFVIVSVGHHTWVAIKAKCIYMSQEKLKFRRI
jgi:hypothetical protein